MKLGHILSISFLMLLYGAHAQNSEINRVTTHDRTTIICDPVTAANPYPSWGIFPDKNASIRKMTMHVTLGSPDSINTAHWDYLDHIILRRKGGTNGPELNYELGRMLTPYGSIFNKGWSWKWQVDVTDFAPLLRDSVEIVYIHTGYEDKTVGWALNIDFDILYGPPIVEPFGIEPLWNKAYKYGDPNERIEEHLLPINYESKKGAVLSRIRIQHTGHGMDRPRGCSEFCSRWREISLDGTVVDKRDMWKRCGDNPLYPQGGTWIYDRAYWCPGDLQKPDIIDIFTKPGKHQVSLMMEPYVATGNIQATENISSFLFHYSAPKQKTDVAVEAIMVPSDEQRFSRLNPASSGPRISFRNLGADPVHSLTIVYGTKGFPDKIFHWKGNLPFNQVADVQLPGVIQENDGQNVFHVTLNKPNGKKDAWTGDNYEQTTFTAPPRLPSTFVLQLLTNKNPEDNSIYLINAQKDTIYQKMSTQLAAETLYTDTIRLSRGNHSLTLIDTAGNGLQFWAQPQKGDGHLRLFDMEGNLIHAFESDCGSGEMFSFKATDGFAMDTTTARHAFSLYPRSVTDQTQLTVVSNNLSDLTVQVTVDGVLWQKHDYKAVKNATFNYDLTHLPKGRIVVEAFTNGISRFKGRLNKR
ncbi:peptide-N-glycosidase F-related protein [Sphingobacterium luzhongxinii]|uniref:peptide-N-glycosidase F-related protein n=1 Tax=Sphingobacterium luzhongxinii TaxID=2654181 RepID=UPI0013D8E505|nr:peptide-N-glycosidase F-related protein [Sphingobacterium sp. xlx-73]